MTFPRQQVCRNIGLVMIFLLGWSGIAPVQAGEPPLVYFFMDGERPAPIKASEVKTMNLIIDALLKESPGSRFYFHMTHTNPSGEAIKLVYDGTRDKEVIRKEFLKAYVGSGLPEKFRQPRRLDEELRLISTNLQKIAHPGPIWLIAFHDMDWQDKQKQITSAGRYLGDGWLSAPASPLQKEFLSQDNSAMKGIKVLVFLSQGGDLSVRRGKERFFAKMFHIVDGALLSLGPLHPYPGGAQAPLATGLVLAAIRQGNWPVITATPPRSVTMLQINGPRDATQTIDVYR